MLRQDFISKIIEQLFTSIAKLMNIDVEKETEVFLATFEELLQTYFKISSDRLGELLKTDEERDAFLFDDKVRTTQLLMFSQAGLAYLKIGEMAKAKDCWNVIERVQNQHSQLYEFPNPDQLKLEESIKNLKTKLEN
jgi:hypothetical protein